MKALAALLLSAIGVAQADEMADRLAAVPNPRAQDSSWVSDPAGVLATRKTDINAAIDAVERKTTAEIAVVVLPTIGELNPKDFAVRLIERWGVGKKGQDNGVLVLHILDQRRIEIETGYGMEGILPDIKCKWITEGIAVPYFRRNSFAEGHFEVVRALVRGIQNPDIGQAELLSSLSTSPGATVDRLGEIPTRAAAPEAHAFDDAKVEKGIGYYIATIAALLAAVAIYVAATLGYRRRAQGKSPYEKHQLFQGGTSRLQYLATLPLAGSAFAFEQLQNDTIFSPLPVLLAGIFGLLWRRSRHLRALRDEPRICQCGKTMRRVSETEDNAYIKEGNVVEESIASMDYDVWVCDSGHSSVEAYKGKSPSPLCPKCSYRTFRITGARTIKSATTTSTGLKETTHKCAHCSYTRNETQVIPKISTSAGSSGRSSGSSGRSGGSFGGGRSGGGGAGSSY